MLSTIIDYIYPGVPLVILYALDILVLILGSWLLGYPMVAGYVLIMIILGLLNRYANYIEAVNYIEAANYGEAVGGSNNVSNELNKVSLLKHDCLSFMIPSDIEIRI